MAKLFDSFGGVVPTWLAASRYLNSLTKREAFNLVLEIQDPRTVTEIDRGVILRVDQALRNHTPDLTVRTVAGTIFPQAFYTKYGSPAFYGHFAHAMVRGKKANTWGTYALRMTSRQFNNATINPLDVIVKRLQESSQPSKKDPHSKPSSYVSAYELGTCDPQLDLTADGAELPLFSSGDDGNKWLGFPCLSHLSFKRVNPAGKATVNMTAFYRSHHYCSRGLGNLIGLAQLLSFVAKESALEMGSLTCISSYATLDVGSFGGVAATTAILSQSSC